MTLGTKATVQGYHQWVVNDGGSEEEIAEDIKWQKP